MRDLIGITLLGALCFLALPSHANCVEDQYDNWKVAKALQQGLTKEALLMHLDGVRAELTPERMEKIRALVDEVFALDPSQAEVWWKSHYVSCPEGEEA